MKDHVLSKTNSTSSIDLIRFDVYFPNSIHTRIQITCDVYKSTLWHKERTLEELRIGQFAYVANNVNWSGSGCGFHDSWKFPASRVSLVCIFSSGITNERASASREADNNLKFNWQLTLRHPYSDPVKISREIFHVERKNTCAGLLASGPSG